MTTTDLVAAYLSGANELCESVAGMSRAQFEARPIPGKWSTLEVLCHLADTEGLYAERIRRILTEDRPPLPGMDESSAVLPLVYARRDASEELAVVQAIRRQMARILAAQPPAAWQRTGVHSEAGELTLEQILQRVVKHLPHHLGFIREKRQALGQAG